jgi:hypothetical protein
MPNLHRCACCGAAIESDCGLPEVCDECRHQMRPPALPAGAQPSLIIPCPEMEGAGADPWR